MAYKIAQVASHSSIMDDFMKSCRVCMVKSYDMKRLFQANCKIAEEIEYCTGILLTKNDNLPSYICLNCLKKLAIAHKFKTTCTKTHDILQSLLRVVEDKLKHEDTNPKDLCLKEEIDSFFVSDNEVVADGNSDNTVPDDEVVEELKDVTELAVKQRPKKKTNSRFSKKTKGLEKNCQEKYELYCKKCNVHFKTKQEAVKHRQQVHKEEEHYLCEVCGKQFTNYMSRYSHIRTHQVPQHKCAHCDYKTTFKYDLAKHIRVHTGEKSYQCHFCTAVYRTSSNLQGHIQRTHTFIKKHQCDRCDRSFDSLNKLNRHLDTHNNIKRHSCEVCLARFTRRCHWKSHLQKQHGVITPRIRPGRQRNKLVFEDTPSIFNK